MITKIKLLVNYKEIERAQELGIEKPAEIYKYTEFGFRLDDVELFYITETKEKDINISIKNVSYIIKYDPEILTLLENKFQY